MQRNGLLYLVSGPSSLSRFIIACPKWINPQHLFFRSCWYRSNKHFDIRKVSSSANHYFVKTVFPHGGKSMSPCNDHISRHLECINVLRLRSNLKDLLNVAVHLFIFFSISLRRYYLYGGHLPTNIASELWQLGQSIDSFSHQQLFSSRELYLQLYWHLSTLPVSGLFSLSDHKHSVCLQHQCPHSSFGYSCHIRPRKWSTFNF